MPGFWRACKKASRGEWVVLSECVLNLKEGSQWAHIKSDMHLLGVGYSQLVRCFLHLYPSIHPARKNTWAKFLCMQNEEEQELINLHSAAVQLTAYWFAWTKKWYQNPTYHDKNTRAMFLFVQNSEAQELINSHSAPVQFTPYWFSWRRNGAVFFTSFIYTCIHTIKEAQGTKEIVAQSVLGKLKEAAKWKCPTDIHPNCYCDKSDQDGWVQQGQLCQTLGKIPQVKPLPVYCPCRLSHPVAGQISRT